jgi:hypothetical protein
MLPDVLRGIFHYEAEFRIVDVARHIPVAVAKDNDETDSVRDGQLFERILKFADISLNS